MPPQAGEGAVAGAATGPTQAGWSSAGCSGAACRAGVKSHFFGCHRRDSAGPGQGGHPSLAGCRERWRVGAAGNLPLGAVPLLQQVPSAPRRWQPAAAGSRRRRTGQAPATGGDGVVSALQLGEELAACCLRWAVLPQPRLRSPSAGGLPRGAPDLLAPPHRSPGHPRGWGSEPAAPAGGGQPEAAQQFPLSTRHPSWELFSEKVFLLENGCSTGRN